MVPHHTAMVKLITIITVYEDHLRTMLVAVEVYNSHLLHFLIAYIRSVCMNVLFSWYVLCFFSCFIFSIIYAAISIKSVCVCVCVCVCVLMCYLRWKLLQLYYYFRFCLTSHSFQSNFISDYYQIQNYSTLTHVPHKWTVGNCSRSTFYMLDANQVCQNTKGNWRWELMHTLFL